ncbi:MAG: NUDIX hydrolase [Saprospiraceae bacterium]|nr:NUDIX hydrolase [Saprospiraceae bacterium]
MTHRIRVAGLVRRGEEFLLIKQQDRFGRLHWSLPGGRLEPSDADMYRGAEREVLEETGLRVHAGALRYVYEYSTTDLFALTLIIECHLAEDEDPTAIHLNNTMEDDHIHDVAWWHIKHLQTDAEDISRTFKNSLFWEHLETGDSVMHLGRWED